MEKVLQFSEEVEDAIVQEFVDTHPTIVSSTTLDESEKAIAGKPFTVDLGLN